MAQQFFPYYDKDQSNLVPRYHFCPLCASSLKDVVIERHLRSHCPDCGFIQHLNPLPGVCVVVEHEGKVLIGKRADSAKLGGKWCLPCGFIDFEETYHEAAHREVLEETNLKIRLTSLMDINSNHITPALHSLVPILTATVVSGTPTPGDDIVELRWISKDCPLPEMAFLSDPVTIKRFFSGDYVATPVDPRFEFASG